MKFFQGSDMGSKSQPASTIHDVIIIGAGISGCGAAWYLHKHRRSSLILEATDRIGGKTYTVPDGCGKSGHIDLGASWVNDSTQTHINALIEEFGLQRIEQNTEGLYIAQDSDGSFFSHDRHDLGKRRGDDIVPFVAKLDEVVQTINKSDVAKTAEALELDSMTILEWTQKTFPDRPGLPKLANILVQAMIGADISQASMLYLAHYYACGGGMKAMLGEDKDDAQYQRLVDGTQAISNAMIAGLPPNSIKLNHAVSSISQEDGIVTITTKNNHQFQAKKAIITISPPLWTSIEWSPPLPERKTIISNNVTMPTYSKIVFAFDRGWWRPQFSGAVNFSGGLVGFIRDTSIPSKECWTLTCFSTGKGGSEWGNQSKERRRQSAWTALRSAFEGCGIKDVAEPVAYREMLWERHEYFWGAPSSSWPPGLLNQGFQKDLKAPFDNVHFAGSETSSDFKGFLEGGLRAAHRAVEEIVK